MVEFFSIFMTVIFSIIITWNVCTIIFSRFIYYVGYEENKLIRNYSLTYNNIERQRIIFNILVSISSKIMSFSIIICVVFTIFLSNEILLFGFICWIVTIFSIFSFLYSKRFLKKIENRKSGFYFNTLMQIIKK